MSRRDLVLAAFVAVLWGLSFVVVKWGLADVPPLLFAALRFGVVAAAAPFLPRPRLPARALLLYGLTWGTLQFGGLFLALGCGLPVGAASIVAQSQIVFTLLFALALRIEGPAMHHVWTIGLAVSGLTVIGSSRADHLPVSGLFFALSGAAGWAAANVLVRRFTDRRLRVDTVAFLAWACIVPAVTLLAMSLLLEGPRQIGTLVAHLSLRFCVALVYQSFFALTAGAVLWNVLLRKYASSTVAPFSLMVPVVGLTAGHIAFGETISAQQWIGSALMLAGLASNVFFSRARAVVRVDAAPSDLSPCPAGTHRNG